VFICLTAYALTSTALVKIPALSAWSGCKLETCLRPMYRLRNYLTIAVYVITMCVFAATLILVRRADKMGGKWQRKSTYCDAQPGSRRGGAGSERKPPKFRFPLWKLTLNVSTFAILNIFYVIWAVGTLVIGARDRCFFQHNLALMWSIIGLVRISLLLRIAIDPLLAFLTDFQACTVYQSRSNYLSTLLPMLLRFRSAGAYSQCSPCSTYACRSIWVSRLAGPTSRPVRITPPTIATHNRRLYR
jgi:hypothetical protein